MPICKSGVKFGGFTPALVTILDALCQVERSKLPGAPETIVITAGSDGTHAADSAHYRFEAVDVRSKNFTTGTAKHAFAAALRRMLGDGYFVDLEHPSAPNEHFHIQKRRG